MILIVSEKEDHNTSEVIQWLLYYGARFKRVNRGDLLTLNKIQLNNSNLKSDSFSIMSKENGQIDIKDVGAFWYRRGEIQFSVPNLDFIRQEYLRKQIYKHLREEYSVIENYLEYLLKEIPHIGTYQRRGVNKLVVLHEARKIGIDIPDNWISGQKENLSFEGTMITKSISEVFAPRTDHGDFMTYTESIDIKRLQPDFFPSLFQPLIEKEADIRIFYLNGKMYSMAIQSQDNSQTTIDFRKYLSKNPNRMISFRIPLDLEEKLIILMDKINLETASIDMILNKDGKFIFLEANPIGQFGMTSKPCNYFLEREVALSLINISKYEINPK